MLRKWWSKFKPAKPRAVPVSRRFTVIAKRVMVEQNHIKDGASIVGNDITIHNGSSERIYVTIEREFERKKGAK